MRLSLSQRVQADPEGFSSLTPDEQAFYAAAFLSAEVRSGGFFQYFDLLKVDYWTATLRCLHGIGAIRSLKILLDAKETLLGTGDLTQDMLNKFQLPPYDPELEWSDRLEELDKQFWEDPDKLGDRLDAFAESRLL